jgi:prephenate dehydratase
VKLFPQSALVPAATFDEACFKVLRGECAMAILPLENTTAGTVDDVASLLDSEPIHIIRTVSVPILHKLLLLPGSDIRQVRTVLSHPQALAQCSKFIKKAGWTPVAVENTAFAAGQVREMNDGTCCAIASGEAAFLNNLQVSDEAICDSIHNQTRFAILCSSLVITDNAERISILFRLAHQTGSLAYVLNLFAERGLNLTKIQSRPVSDRPWEYSFWVDLVARRGDPDAMLALYQLSRELPFLKLLGWYEETTVTVQTYDDRSNAKESGTP